VYWFFAGTARLTFFIPHAAWQENVPIQDQSGDIDVQCDGFGHSVAEIDFLLVGEDVLY